MPRDRLIGNYRTALGLMLFFTFLYSLVRGIVLLTHIGYETYRPEFQDISRTVLGSHWVLTAILLAAGLWSPGFFLWRMGLISASAGLITWAVLFFTNRGIRVFDGIWTYAIFGIIFLAVAILGTDPRPVRKLRESIDSVYPLDVSNRSR